MKKITFTLAIAACGFFATNAVAQDNTEAVQTERSAENIKKEADALKKRIDQQIIKVEANKASVDYEAEMERIAELKAKWETLSGKTWEEQEKLDKL